MAPGEHVEPDLGSPSAVEKSLIMRLPTDLDIHDRLCPHRFDHSAFRFHDCPECGRCVDTFGGNV